MLNMTFDDGVEDTAKGSFVEVGQGLPLPTRSDPQQRPRRGGNRAAYFTDTALNIWYFSGKASLSLVTVFMPLAGFKGRLLNIFNSSGEN